MRTAGTNILPDTILYTAQTVAGGVDGLDTSDKGGVVVFAAWDQVTVTTHIGKDPRYEIVKTIVNEDDVKAALSKLNTVETLLVKYHFNFVPMMPR